MEIAGSNDTIINALMAMDFLLYDNENAMSEKKSFSLFLFLFVCLSVSLFVSVSLCLSLYRPLVTLFRLSNMMIS